MPEQAYLATKWLPPCEDVKCYYFQKFLTIYKLLLLLYLNTEEQ